MQTDFCVKILRTKFLIPPKTNSGCCVHMAATLSVRRVYTEESSLLDQLNKQISQIRFPSDHTRKPCLKRTIVRFKILYYFESGYNQLRFTCCLNSDDSSSSDMLKDTQSFLDCLVCFHNLMLTRTADYNILLYVPGYQIANLLQLPSLLPFTPSSLDNDSTILFGLPQNLHKAHELAYQLSERDRAKEKAVSLMPCCIFSVLIHLRRFQPQRVL